MQDRLPLSSQTVLQDRYRIIGILGEGGMGRVYEATDLRLNISVAIKELFDPEYKTAFNREVKLLANLTHPLLPRSTDFFDEGSRSYFVMELIEGESLGDRLRIPAIPFGPSEVLEIASQVLDALIYLHANGIVHRDIKPLNIKRDKSGKCRLLDFGIAKGVIGDITTVESRSFAGATKSYAPLEQLLKSDMEAYGLLGLHFDAEAKEFFERRTDPRSDIYALGATLHHLLIGILPEPSYIRAFSIWSGKGDRMSESKAFENLPEKDVFSLIVRSMAINPEDRFQSALEMEQRVRKIQDSVDEADDPQTAPLSQLDRDFKSGKIDLYTYAKAKYPGVPADSTVTSGAVPQEDELTMRLAEQIRRAELLGFNDLLKDLKDEPFTIDADSVKRVERMIDAEIKISEEMEIKEVHQKWRTVQEEESLKRKWGYAVNENLRVSEKIDALEREARRKRILITVVLAVILAIGSTTALLNFRKNVGTASPNRNQNTSTTNRQGQPR